MVAWNTGGSTLWTKTNQLLWSRTGENQTAPFDGTVWNNNATFGSEVSATGVTHQTFYSESMKRTVGYCIFLPVGYPAAAPYNVIYKYNASGGNENLTCNALLAHFAAAQPVVVVFVNEAQDALFRDSKAGSPMDGVIMVETMLIAELLPVIEAKYSVKTTRGGRAVTGFSTGGMGALRMAFKYPEKFSSVYAYSPTMDDRGSNLLSNEAALASNMFSNDTTLFETGTVQSLATSNAANIISNAPAIHFTYGSTETARKTESDDLHTQLTGLSIVHDAPDSLSGVGHDQAASWASQGGHTDLDFMWSHFS